MTIKPYTLQQNNIPDVLKNIDWPPKQLHVLGNLEQLMDTPRVAVVGSRKVSPYGRQITQNLTEEMARCGITIISGLALGLDAIAHRAALDAGGKCIAVLPTSLHQIYPAAHRQLAEDIVNRGGALVSEYDKGAASFKSNFVARNRLVSGLCDGVLVTEAALKSGSLHTAKFALDQGRTVMAVPGNINSVTSQGTNNLIKSGAVVVTEIADVLTALHLTPKDLQRQLPLGDNAYEQAIIDIIAGGIHDSADILAKSSMPTSLFNQTLTMLEITGKITPLGAGKWGLR